MSESESVLELVCPTRWAGAWGAPGVLAQPQGCGAPWLGPSSSLEADGKWAHFWVCSGAFTETTDPFVERLVVQPQSYRALPRELIRQGTTDGSRARWNLDHQRENMTQHPSHLPGL